MPENNNEDFADTAPPTGIRTANLYITVCFQIRRSLTELYRDTYAIAQKLQISFANHLFREYRERTTPSRIFVPCNLSSCKGSYAKMYPSMTNHSLPHLVVAQLLGEILRKLYRI